MGILLRNWPLKLSSVLLATVLYTGLVFSGSFSESEVDVRIEGRNPPDSSIVMSGDFGVVSVQYRASNELSPTVGAQAFVATVDLSGYDMERAPEPQVLDVDVSALPDGIEVLNWEPRTVRVQLDRVVARTVPVEVDPGDIPEGLEIEEPILSDDEVEVRGAASVVGLVDRALARVSIDASGINFNRPVNLVPVDVEGQQVGAGLIDVEPETISVQIEVRFTETSVTVPVRPDITGTPAPGFALVSLTVEPSTVTLRGLPDVLATVDEVLTEELSIDGVSTDQVFETELVLPEDTSLAEEAAEGAVTVTAAIGPSVSSRTFVVGVVCQGAGGNACLPSLDQLTLTLSGPGEALSELTAAELTPILDVTGLPPGTHNVTPVVPSLPDGVEVLAVTPTTVAVTIEQPATPTPAP